MRPWLLLALLLFSCRLDPEPLPLPPRDSPGEIAAASTPALEIAPPPIQGKIAPVVHLRLPLPGDTLVAPSAIVLVRGELSDTALRGLREGTLPASTLDRVVPSTLRSVPGSIHLFPREPLLPGNAYTLAVGPLQLRIPLVVGEEGPPMLARIWPPAGEDSEDALAIFCGAGALPEAFEAEGLGASWALQRGAPTRPDAASCVTLTATDDAEIGSFPAALLASGERIAALAPAPLRRGSRPPLAAPSCATEELSFGPGCLLAQDDRARWRLPAEPWLLLSGGEGPTTMTGGALIRGLSPASEVTIEARVLDLRGELHHASATVTTTAPQPHVVLSEALADALGPEPAAEWVELYNDGALPWRLEGWSLEDGQGLTPLPTFELAPGAFALLANENLDTSADRPAAPGCQIVHVPKLGKSGLSNQGEALALLDAAGNARSRLPATPRPKPGQSLNRTRMESPYEDGGNFTLATPTPCAPLKP
jgi:hypothetical protein